MITTGCAVQTSTEAFDTAPEHQGAARAAVLDLDRPDVAEALAAHPRIGDRPEGDGRKATWSRQEQQGVAAAAEVVIAFRITDPGAHHHVPLVLSPFAFSTYRGS
jgi:hypothetical protein